MSKRPTIAEVKQRLLEETSIDNKWLEDLYHDERKGVQVALKQYEKRQQEQARIHQHILQLRQKEKILHQEGYQLIAGVDEVGRGPLAGPVVAGAVILPADMPEAYFNDSKQLSHAKRQSLVADIEKYAISYAVAGQSAQIIDQVNILEATKQAMTLALKRLTSTPDYVLIDAVHLDSISHLPQESIIKGDATVYSIAAESIYYKEKRDELMAQYAEQYPGYGFEHNAGYGTKEHLEGLKKYGPCPIHRCSFAPVKAYL